MKATARELADEFLASRRKVWEKSDPTVAVVATEHLNPEDEATVRRMVAKEGYEGHDYDEMVKKVTSLIIGTVEALADHMPADNGD
jgi:hypothetical protein